MVDVEQIAEQVVHRPPALLAPYVDFSVGYRYAGFPPGDHMGLPSRHLTFVISFDAPLELAVLPDGSHHPTLFDAAISGFHTTPAVIRHDGNQHGIQLHVTPAGARALFGMPAAELASVAVPLEEVWGRSAGELVERLAATTGWRDRFAVLDRLLLRALAVHVEIPSGARPEATEALRRMIAMAGQVEVGALASSIGWSRRHLSEQFRVEYGVSPKAMARVLRFERAKGMIVRPDRASLAQVAAECGYTDQAHMAREWQALAGASPTAWMAAEQLPFVQDIDDDEGAPWSA